MCSEEESELGNANQDGYHSFNIVKRLNRRRFPTFEAFRRFSRACSIDMAPKVLFSKSVSVTELIRSGVSNYLEFQNVTDTFFYSIHAKKFVQIPFTKSEISFNTFLSFKEKR